VPNESVAPPPQKPPSQLEYEHLLSAFKYLVTLSTAFISLIIGVGAYLFHTNMKEVRDDAKQEATRVATAEAKASVAEAFDEKNIKAMILVAAQQKIGTITDKLIEQQVTEKLRPLQQRISLTGQISECEMRMRLGFRSGLDELNRLLKSTTDPDIVRFGKSTLAIVSEDFEVRLQEEAKSAGSAMQLMNVYLSRRRPPEAVPGNLHSVVQVIYQDSNLNAVAIAFLAFRETTGVTVKMFDFAAITSWCSQNQTKCQNP
jgi:hypothetical protein